MRTWKMKKYLPLIIIVFLCACGVKHDKKNRDNSSNEPNDSNEMISDGIEDTVDAPLQLSERDSMPYLSESVETYKPVSIKLKTIEEKKYQRKCGPPLMDENDELLIAPGCIDTWIIYTFTYPTNSNEAISLIRNSITQKFFKVNDEIKSLDSVKQCYEESIDFYFSDTDSSVNHIQPIYAIKISKVNYSERVFVFSNYLYWAIDALAAHGLYPEYHYCYSLISGEQILWTDLFNPKDEQAIIQLLKEASNNKYENGLYISDNYYIEPSGITFVYNAYELDCFAAGNIRINVPYALIDPFLREGASKYFAGKDNMDFVQPEYPTKEYFDRMK